MSVLYVVATPIGNLKDITQRAIETLQNSDIILCEDTRTSQKLLSYYDINKPLVSYHKFNEDRRSDEIIDKMKNENLVVSIITDAGTPCISDPGTYIVKKARENNLDVFVIPGASAVISAISVSGIFFDSFCFLGFFPRDNKGRSDVLKNMKESFCDTFVIYESPIRIKTTIKMLSQNLDQSYIVCCNDLTKKFENYYCGTPEQVYEQLNDNDNSDLGEYVICIKVEKKQVIQQEEKDFLELKIVRCMLEENCSMKDAIQKLRDNYPKNKLYTASLKLKDMFS